MSANFLDAYNQVLFVRNLGNNYTPPAGWTMFTSGGNATSFVEASPAAAGIVDINNLGASFVSVVNNDFPHTPVRVVNPPDDCCNIRIVSSSVYPEDRISPLIGGMREPFMSKTISPHRVIGFDRIEPCGYLPFYLFIGSNTQTGCCKDFFCDETYYFRVVIDGTSAYSTYFRNINRIVAVQTPCCPPPDCTNQPCVYNNYVQPQWVYLQLANNIANDPELKQFLFPMVLDGNTWYAPPKGLYPDLDGLYNNSGQLVVGSSTFDPWTTLPYYSSGPAMQNQTFCSAPIPSYGVALFSAYVETRFGNCTFMPQDNFNFEPVKVTVSEVDWSGNKCIDNACIFTICDGRVASGTGEQALRDLIHHETVRGNYKDPGCELRFRETEQTNAIISLVPRDGQFYRYIIRYNVPETVNPNNNYRDSKYQLHIISPYILTSLETWINSWLEMCGECPGLRTFDCGAVCDTLIPGTGNVNVPQDIVNLFSVPYAYAPAPQRGLNYPSF